MNKWKTGLVGGLLSLLAFAVIAAPGREEIYAPSQSGTGDPPSEIIRKVNKMTAELYSSTGTVSTTSLGLINVTEAPYSAVCDATVAGTGTDDTAAIQAAVDAIPAGSSGTIYAPRKCLISIPIEVNNKQSIAFVGPASSNMLRPATKLGPMAGFVTTPGFGATSPAIHVTVTVGTTEGAGATTLVNFALIPGTTLNGYGILFEKDTGVGRLNFWGNVYILNSTISQFAKGVAFDDSANHLFAPSSPTANGNGFGWVFILGSRLTGNTFAFQANCDMNVVQVHNNVFMHNHGGGSGNFETRSGGAVVIRSGLLFSATGNDFEDSQVGVAMGAYYNTNVSNNYFETMGDAAVVLIGSRSATIENNYTLTNPAWGTDIVYARLSRNVTIRGNQADTTVGMYGVLAGVNRDFVTDFPSRTRFTTGITGSKTLDDKGVLVQSLHTFLKQQPVASNASLSSAALVNATQAEITGTSPLGFNNKGMAITPTAVNGTMQPTWTNVPVVEGQWLVSTMLVRMDTAATPTASALFVQENKGLGAGLETAFNQGIDSTMMRKGEVVAIQWHHKVLTGESANFTTNMESRIPGYITVPSLVIDTLKVYGLSQVISNLPLVRPTVWEMVSSGGTERYSTADGKVFYGANGATAPPAAATLTWSVGERVWRTAPAAGETTAWTVTTGGVGGVAVFSTGQGVFNTSTWAARGAGNFVGEQKRMTDIGPSPGAVMIWNGTYWRLVGKTFLLADTTLVTSPADTAENILKQYTLPAGILRAGTRLSVQALLGRTGVTDTQTNKLRFGVLGTTSDTTVASSAVLAGGTLRSYAIETLFHVLSATSLTIGGVPNGAGGFANATTAVAGGATLTVADLDVNPLVLTQTMTSVGATNQGQAFQFFVVLEP